MTTPITPTEAVRVQAVKREPIFAPGPAIYSGTTVHEKTGEVQHAPLTRLDPDGTRTVLEREPPRCLSRIAGGPCALGVGGVGLSDECTKPAGHEDDHQGAMYCWPRAPLVDSAVDPATDLGPCQRCIIRQATHRDGAGYPCCSECDR